MAADRRPRASQWDSPSAEKELNPLGRRVLNILRNWRKDHPDKGASDFSVTAQGDKGRIHTHLVRLKTPEYRLDVDSLVNYAKAGRVSLFWLITGEGLPFDGPFAEPVPSDLGGLPESLQRAARAAAVTLGCSNQSAIAAARRAREAFPNSERDAEGWLAIVLQLVKESPGESGERPSVRLRRAES